VLSWSHIIATFYVS